MLTNKIKRLVLSIFVAISILIVSGAIYQFVVSECEELLYPVPGKLVDVGGYRLHINYTGSFEQTGPTVVLDAGLRCNCLDWALVQPEIAKFNQVCSYDRAGNGWSDESFLPRTSLNIVDELHTLLKNAQIPGPYILVGHSFGGLNARLYAARYPDEVAAIVLVDSPHEDLLHLSPLEPDLSLIEKVITNPNVALFGTYVGGLRLRNSFTVHAEKFKPFPEDIQQVYRAKVCTPKFVRTILRELACLDESMDQLRKAEKSCGVRTLGSTPLVVITAGKCISSEESGRSQVWLDRLFGMHLVLQKDLVEKSINSKEIVAFDSDHMITHYQPEIIVDAVKEVVGQCRASQVNQTVGD